MAVSLDGVMVPMKDANRAAKREQLARRRVAGYEGTGGVSGGGLCDAVVLRCPRVNASTRLYMGRMPEPKKAALKTIP